MFKYSSREKTFPQIKGRRIIRKSNIIISWVTKVYPQSSASIWQQITQQTKILTQTNIHKKEVNKQKTNKYSRLSSEVCRYLTHSLEVSKYPLQYLSPMGWSNYYFTSYKTFINPHQGFPQYLTYSLEVFKYCLLCSMGGCPSTYSLTSYNYHVPCLLVSFLMTQDLFIV